jgi:predicted HTH transcriptional regulator
MPLTVSEMLEIANDRGLVSWELQPARKATMQDINLERVKSFLNQRSTRSGHSARFDDLEKVLVGMDCAIVANNGEIKPTNVGILFFGYDPQLSVPQSEVVCVIYRDEIGVGGYVDRRIITGTLLELIDETETFLNKYIAVGAKIEGWKRIDLPEYPIEALREAIVNAVIHRDYSRVGESIRIFYYSDRVEIHSPGLLLPGITVEQMSRGAVMSKLRNRTMAGLLRDIPGYMERVGSGVRLMLNEMKRMKLPAPEFREMSEFVVTFHKAPVSNISGPSNDEEQTIIVAPGREVPLEHDQRLALAMRYVQQHGFITNQEYRKLTGASDRSALRDLGALVAQGALKMVGKKRARRYELP